MRAWSLFLPIVQGACVAFAQEDSTWVRYQGGFDFHEGIYRDFQAFRHNAPSIPLARLTGDQGVAVRDIRTAERIFASDSTGGRSEVDLDRIWGFCSNNVVYLRAGNGFYRIGQWGAISHVLFEYSHRDWDPYDHESGTTAYSVQAQYVLVMKTGEFLEFHAGNLEKLLADDEALKAEWDVIPPKKRKEEVLYLFLRRYNEAHPLYFPR